MSISIENLLAPKSKSETLATLLTQQFDELDPLKPLAEGFKPCQPSPTQIKLQMAYKKACDNLKELRGKKKAEIKAIALTRLIQRA